MRIAALALFLALSACANDKPSTDCGDNGTSHHSDELGAICSYIVIIGGFDCPPGLPHQMDFGGGAICSERPGDPGDIPLEVCEHFMVDDCPSLLEDATVMPNDTGVDSGAPTETCMELDLRFSLERAPLTTGLLDCDDVGDCATADPSLSCDVPDIQLLGCPVALRADQAQTYEDRVNGLADSICLPGGVDCFAGPSCAPMDLACVAGQCQLVPENPCSSATDEQSCRDLGGDCTPHVGTNITTEMGGEACWDPSSQGAMLYVECLNVPNPPPPTTIMALHPDDGECYEFGLAIRPTGWELCEGNLPQCM